MDTIESAGCVQFKPLSEKTENATWLHITNPHKQRDCVHQMKSTDEKEIVAVLGYDCLKDSDILHVLLHAVGLRDEVTHPQRDRFIRVLWNNIRPEHRSLYRLQVQDASKVLSEYDPLSIMHFHDRAFSSNGQATIVPLVPGLMISPSKQLSQLDVMKLRLLFEHECNKRKVSNLLDSCKSAFHEKLKGSMHHSIKFKGSSSESDQSAIDLLDDMFVEMPDDKKTHESQSDNIEVSDKKEQAKNNRYEDTDNDDDESKKYKVDSDDRNTEGQNNDVQSDIDQNYEDIINQKKNENFSYGEDENRDISEDNNLSNDDEDETKILRSKNHKKQFYRGNAKKIESIHLKPVKKI
ncbi:unnamed protein product [Leptosia nina]|uniref:Metalloendopeptidase n=1 Tax=Leptosia nina TaxID=320188 RepID=A0AAV1IX59_9NEOP